MEKRHLLWWCLTHYRSVVAKVVLAAVVMRVPVAYTFKKVGDYAAIEEASFCVMDDEGFNDPFLFHHEEGHLVHGHLTYQGLTVNEYGMVDDLGIEFKADEHAVSRIGYDSVLKGLASLIQKYKSARCVANRSIAIDRLEVRIKNIKQLREQAG
jgi:hypothetical protein